MKENQEETEGQSIARSILAGEANAWNEFQLSFGQKISEFAVKRSKSVGLRSEYSAEDIINGFMVEQLLKQPEKMFGPVAKGQRPLTPRLLRSLTNFCNSLQRRRKGTVHIDMSREADLVDQANIDPDFYPHEVALLTKKRIDEQQRTIRETFSVPSRIRVPQREILLLSERVWFAEQIALSHCNEYHSTHEQDASKALVLRLYPWSKDESVTLIPMANETLSAIWEVLSPILFSPPFGVDGSEIAERIQVPRNTWDIWVRRARQRVIAFASVQKAKDLFPAWPQRLFEFDPEAIISKRGEQNQ